MKRSTHAGTTQVRPSAGISVGAAVFFALYGMQRPAMAQQPPESAPGTLAEVVVTATRHELTLEAVPYSMSVVGATDLERVRDVALRIEAELRTEGDEWVDVMRFQDVELPV